MARGKRLANATRRRLRQRRIENLPTARNKIEHILEYGVLAPSTHNTQPWKLEINSNKVEIYADFDKKIPEADPTGRDLYMSLGALIKNIELASKEFGLDTKTAISKSLEEQPHIATLTFSNIDKAENPDNSEMLDALIARQNYRGFFRPELNQSVAEQTIKSVKSREVVTQVFFEKNKISELADLTVQGLREAYKKPTFRKEISTFINHNLSRKRHGLHGYSLRMNLPASFVIPKVMRRKDIGSKLAELNYKSFISAPGVVVLASKDDELSWLRSGMVLEEIMVRLSIQGITSSIYAAAIEMGDLRQRLSKVTKTPEEVTPQLLFCIGEPTTPLPYSVRKKLSAVLMR